MRGRMLSGKGLVPLLISSLIILFLTGCAENSSILDNGKSQQLEFSVTTYGWNSSKESSNRKFSSRATPISGNTFDTSKSFNVIADVNHGGNWSTEVENEAVSYSTVNNIWQTTATHYWPGAGSTVDFYAYYPTSISGSITHTTGSVPVFPYTVPDNVADQIDILASSKTGVAGDSYNQTPVDFKHILSAVQFCVGSSGMINGTITKISLNGIQNTGSYSFTSGWTPQTSSTTTYTKNVYAASDAGTEIVSGNDPFLVMPQTLSNASFTVTYSGGVTLTKSLSGIWEAGKVYDYNINSSFSATQDFSYTGGVQSYTVPFTGTYKLEVWGAQGGNGGGYGGYSYGNIHLAKNVSIYIYVGGIGYSCEGNIGGGGGYNGGGKGGNGYNTALGGGGGGGATHIAAVTGLLSTLASQTSNIIIVAGGGGGTAWGIGGTGGGLSGGKSGGWNDGVGNTSIGKSVGGTQTTGYVFGLGQDGRTSVESLRADDVGNGGGGGGWYGGYSYQSTGYASNESGGGGSGHLGSTLISGATGMQNGIRFGNGHARITFVSAN